MPQLGKKCDFLKDGTGVHDPVADANGFVKRPAPGFVEPVRCLGRHAETFGEFGDGDKIHHYPSSGEGQKNYFLVKLLVQKLYDSNGARRHCYKPDERFSTRRRGGNLPPWENFF
jgi:hypothetical protein